MIFVLTLTLILSLLPLGMLIANLKLYQPLASISPADMQARPSISLLIPARNEAQSIEACLYAACASTGADLEIIVLDDHSTDNTAALVQRIAASDARVRLEHAPDLPEGWCGKQHACHVLASHASHDLLSFIDVDVHLAPDALSRAAHAIKHSQATLISGFPKQRCVTWCEQLVVPLIHLVLLCYLPIWQMRKDRSPGLGAGCGQWFITQREAYDKVGGHATIQSSLHDGVTLPRAYRKAGEWTDIFDATDTARCRMYRSAGEVWRGFAKNATEGMAGSITIWVWTVLLTFGHILPWFLLLCWLAGYISPMGFWHSTLLLMSFVASAACSILLGIRFEQPVLAWALRPVGVAIMLAIQWYARMAAWLGKPVGWRGRAYH